MASIVIDRLDGLSSSTAVKGPALVATTANLVLNGLKTVDGVALASGDRVLVKNQTDARENGLWVADTGNWRRAADFNKTGDVANGTQIFVSNGDLYARSGWTVAGSAPIVVGDDDITIEQNVLVNGAQLLALEVSAQSAAERAEAALADALAMIVPDNAVTNNKVSPTAGIQASKLSFQHSAADSVALDGRVWISKALSPWMFREAGDPDDTLSIQRMLTALGADKTRYARLAPGGYAISNLSNPGTLLSALRQPAGTVVEAAGAELVMAPGFVGRAWRMMGSKSQLLGISVTGVATNYGLNSGGIIATGQYFGGTTEPVYISDLVLDIWGLNNLENYACEINYTNRVSVDLRSVRNVGYAALFGTSTYELVGRVNIDTVWGETNSGELNAYGVTATREAGALAGSPRSRNWTVTGRVANIPSWEALDCHDGENITFCDFDLINCRRGVIFTHQGASGSGSIRCVAQNIRYMNELTGTNSNGASKQGEVYGDIGPSDAVRNVANKAVGFTSYQGGTPNSDIAAYYVQNSDDAVIKGCEINEPWGSGITAYGNTNRLKIDCTSISNPKQGAGGWTTSPRCVGFRNSQNYNAVVAHGTWSKTKGNTGGNYYGEVGLVVDNTPDKSIHLGSNINHGLTAFSSVPNTTGMTGVYV